MHNEDKGWSPIELRANQNHDRNTYIIEYNDIENLNIQDEGIIGDDVITIKASTFSREISNNDQDLVIKQRY